MAEVTTFVVPVIPGIHMFWGHMSLCARPLTSSACLQQCQRRSVAARELTPVRELNEFNSVLKFSPAELVEDLDKSAITEVQ